jgi:hypothetical protein
LNKERLGDALLKDDFMKKLFKAAKEVVSEVVDVNGNDICETPAPAESIPIPYPNIGKSIETTSGSARAMSSGDEEGSKKRFRKVR